MHLPNLGNNSQRKEIPRLGQGAGESLGEVWIVTDSRPCPWISTIQDFHSNLGGGGKKTAPPLLWRSLSRRSMEARGKKYRWDPPELGRGQLRL